VDEAANQCGELVLDVCGGAIHPRHSINGRTHVGRCRPSMDILKLGEQISGFDLEPLCVDMKLLSSLEGMRQAILGAGNWRLAGRIAMYVKVGHD
jgi:hypothetical protein